MTTQEALKKATEVGYHIHSADSTTTDNGSSCMVGVQETLLDPIFWFALGWALGWNEKKCLGYDQWWREPWHRFLDCLADGKTPEDFFETLE